MTHAEGEPTEVGAPAGAADPTHPDGPQGQPEELAAVRERMRKRLLQESWERIQRVEVLIGQLAEEWTLYVADSRANIEKRQLTIHTLTMAESAARAARNGLDGDDLTIASESIVNWTGVVSQLSPSSIAVEPFYDRLIELSTMARSVTIARKGNPFTTDAVIEHLQQIDLLLSDLQIARLNQAGEKAQTVLAETEAAAGKVGANTIAQFFDDFAKRQLGWSLALWLLMIALVAIVIVGGAKVVFSPKFSTLTVGEVLGRATLTLPILALAAYFGRQASLFADARRRAHEASVRLKTIGAYTAEMSSEQRASVFELFSRTLYGRIDWSQSEDGPTNLEMFNTVMDALPKLASKS